MKRPDHLPEFSKPPLDEVVLGLQFSPVPSYASVHSMGVWDLFREEFPKIDEKPLIDTQFETFGGTNINAGPRIQIGVPPVGSRLWFLSQDENHILQFQSDRLIANWRGGSRGEEYPRFEGIAERFKTNLDTLSEYFRDHFSYEIDVNQAEVSYINIIPVEDFGLAGDWLRIWQDCGVGIESLSMGFTEVVNGDNGIPCARLKHDIQTVFTPDGREKAIKLALTFRGKPEANTTKSAMEFLAKGRETIVMRFWEITTTKAHENWMVAK